MDISVIIPALNEESCLAHTLDQLAMDRPAEVIVADGGSLDATASIAAKRARLIRAPRGRASQQNMAARAARGEILMFLHADTWPEPGWQDKVRRAMERPQCIAGCFQMCIDAPGRVFRAIERGGDLRVRWLGLPYGDQGIFLRRDTFWKLGGFPLLTFMEDLQLMRKARGVGRIHLVQHPIHVSARRWRQTGAVRQTLRNWLLTALAVWGGIDPNRLAHLYPPVR